jgi:hypothetical protein
MRKKGMTQRVAAARAGIAERTARKYERAAALPSQLKRSHDWKTRIDPFEEDWSWVVSQLERDAALQGSTLFALLCERHPDRYRPTQVRTLQRHIQHWRVLHGPDREVMFAQQHIPGERGQSDFTHMEDLGVTIADVPFPHMVHHFVLTYSNVEAVSICFELLVRSPGRRDRKSALADRWGAFATSYRSFDSCGEECGQGTQPRLDEAL